MKGWLFEIEIEADIWPFSYRAETNLYEMMAMTIINLILRILFNRKEALFIHRIRRVRKQMKAESRITFVAKRLR